MGASIKTWHFALPTALLLMAVLWGYHAGLLTDFIVWLQSTQRELHRQLTHAMHGAAGGDTHAAWMLVAISLVYGVFHAAGPGHGKAVIATYLGSNAIRLRRGIILAILGSLFQGLTAILIVEVAGRLLGWSMRQVQAVGTAFENISFALICVLGAMVALRAMFTLLRRSGRAGEDESGRDARRERLARDKSFFDGGGRMQTYCGACGVFHSPAREHIAQPISLRSAVTVVLSMGLRPCTGALLVLLVARSLNVPWAGVGAALAMAIGTSFTVAALAAATVYSRNGGMALLDRVAGGTQHVRTVFTILSMMGGLLLLLLGMGLLAQGMEANTHPLLVP